MIGILGAVGSDHHRPDLGYGVATLFTKLDS